MEAIHAHLIDIELLLIIVEKGLKAIGIFIGFCDEHIHR